jgi:hypothetical protein
MSKLTAAQRRMLPRSEFAIPEARAYPIPDRAHAEDALRMIGHAPPGWRKRIRAEVKRRYGIG